MNNLEGIIYKVSPYLENSKLLNVFTKEGKVTLLARGAQKLNSSFLVVSQYLNKISFEKTNGKDFYYLKNVKLINEFNEIKTNFNNMKSVSLMLELINRTIIDERYFIKVYNLLNDCLSSNLIKEASLSFALKLLYILGVGPNLVGDGKNIVGFNIKGANLVYENSDYYLDLNKDETLTLLKLVYKQINELENMKNDEIKVIEKFVYYYYIDKLDLKLKALE